MLLWERGIQGIQHPCGQNVGLKFRTDSVTWTRVYNFVSFHSIFSGPRVFSAYMYFFHAADGYVHVDILYIPYTADFCFSERSKQSICREKYTLGEVGEGATRNFFT
jgi:FAD/FMN-containing dehydrogenase